MTEQRAESREQSSSGGILASKQDSTVMLAYRLQTGGTLLRTHKVAQENVNTGGELCSLLSYLCSNLPEANHG